MKPKKKKEKLVIRFDLEARKEYLTGFQKRNRLKKIKAKSVKVKLEKDQLKKLRLDKRGVMKKKLEKYGLVDDVNQVSKPQNSPLLQTHPHHVVMIDTNPHFGTSLSSMVDETEPSEVCKADDNITANIDKKCKRKFH